MNFTWINKQGIKADSGFILQRIDRFTYEYYDGKFIIQIPIEPGTKYSILLEKVKPIIHKQGYNEIALISNLEKALLFMQIDFEIV
jgi:hypothetical protein